MELICKYPMLITGYIFISVTMSIYLLIRNKRRKHKFKSYKETYKLFFGLYKLETESTTDTFVEELWNENQKLETEIKILKKKNNDITFEMVRIVFIMWLVSIFINLKVIDKKKN